MRAKLAAPIVFLLNHLQHDEHVNILSSPISSVSKLSIETSPQAAPLKNITAFHSVLQQAFCVNESNAPARSGQHHDKAPLPSYADPVYGASIPLPIPILRISQETASSSLPEISNALKHVRLGSQYASSAPSDTLSGACENTENEQIKVVVAAKLVSDAKDVNKGWGTWLAPSGSKTKIGKRDLNVFAPSSL